MARINVDDSLYIDPRFRALTRKVGCEDKALGMCIRFWRLAQSHWAKGSLIPMDEFELEDLSYLLEIRLAEIRQGCVYAKGSEEHFDWYKQRVNASKKAVEKRRNKDSGPPAKEKNAYPDNPPALALTLINNSSSCASNEAPPSDEGTKTPDAEEGKDTYSSIFKAWQDHHGSLSPVYRLTEVRRKKLRTRWEEEPNPDYWVRAVQKMAASSFMRGWKNVGFDWLIENDNNHVKVMEGKYDDRDSEPRSTVLDLSSRPMLPRLEVV